MMIATDFRILPGSHAGHDGAPAGFRAFGIA